MTGIDADAYGREFVFFTESYPQTFWSEVSAAAYFRAHPESISLAAAIWALQEAVRRFTDKPPTAGQVVELAAMRQRAIVAKGPRMPQVPRVELTEGDAATQTQKRNTRWARRFEELSRARPNMTQAEKARLTLQVLVELAKDA